MDKRVTHFDALVFTTKEPFKGLVVSISIFIQFVSNTTINVPADYSTIQAGIDASANGDTVLVQQLYVKHTFDETGR